MELSMKDEIRHIRYILSGLLSSSKTLIMITIDKAALSTGVTIPFRFH